MPAFGTPGTGGAREVVGELRSSSVRDPGGGAADAPAVDGVAPSIRGATANDLPLVRALLAEAGLPTEGLDEQFGAGYAVAVTGDGTVVGAEGIEVYGAYGLLRSAVVSPAFRGRGLGEALTRDRLAWAGREGLSALYLLTTTAASFFPRFGFEVIDRRAVPPAVQASREVAGVCPSSATVMRLELADDGACRGPECR